VRERRRFVCSDVAETVMIALVRNALVVIGTALSIIGIVDLSARALITGVTLMAAAWAVHRRGRAAWWIISAALGVAFGASLLQFFHGPRSPVAFMCSLLGTLTILLISSWWWRQKAHFRAPRLTSR
jgi:hypothetical protein